MANRYWVGGAGTWDNATTTNWSDTSGGPSGFSAPTTADDVFFNSSSGSGAVTISTSAACRDFDATGFTGNFAGTTAMTIAGSATWGSANGANTYTGTITFSSTATGKTITYNGKGPASSHTFNGVGGGWTVADNPPSATTKTWTVTNGSLDITGRTLDISKFDSNNSNTRSITATNASITMASNSYAFDMQTTTGLTWTGSNCALKFTSNSTTYFGVATTAGSGITVGNLEHTGTGQFQILAPNSSGSTLNNITATNSSSFYVYNKHTANSLTVASGTINLTACNITTVTNNGTGANTINGDCVIGTVSGADVTTQSVTTLCTITTITSTGNVNIVAKTTVTTINQTGTGTFTSAGTITTATTGSGAVTISTGSITTLNVNSAVTSITIAATADVTIGTLNNNPSAAQTITVTTGKKLTISTLFNCVPTAVARITLTSSTTTNFSLSLPAVTTLKYFDVQYCTNAGSYAIIVDPSTSTVIGSSTLIDPLILNKTYPTPVYKQELATGDTNGVNVYPIITGTSDGSVIIVGSNGSMYRYALDINTGFYRYTHTGGSIPNSKYGSIVIIGLYVYVLTPGITNLSITRYNLADLGTSTSMTIPTTACSSTAVGWTDGTDLYWISNDSSTTSRRWTISGTTMTEAATKTITSYSGSGSNYMYDGKNIYLVNKSNSVIYKLADAFAVSKSSVAIGNYQVNYSLGTSNIPHFGLINIPNGKMYVATPTQYVSVGGSTPANTVHIILDPHTKPTI